MKRHYGFLAVALAAAATCGAAGDSDPLTRSWKARWIVPPNTRPHDYGVCYFRRTFTLEAKPREFGVLVTADNRYQLFVNGTRVAWGPARGDLGHWRYEAVDIAAQLGAGKNVIAAVVWNDGPSAAIAQISNQTGFLLEGAGDSPEAKAVSTGTSWRTLRDEAYTPVPIPGDQVTGYHALGPNERMDGRRYPWGWEQPGFDDASWQPAIAGTAGNPRDAQDAPNRWMLVPRSIPPMEETPERLSRVREAQGVKPPATFPAKAAAFVVPANTTARLLLDRDHLTTAFPELVTSGGRGAEIGLRYAEGLWQQGKREKGDREEIAGKRMLGYQDVFVADGGAHRLYRPLFWRTFRYLELTVKTGGEPVTIEDLRGVYTGYPFERRAVLETGRPEIGRMLDVGWRTARLCSHETYMDCPYYEQLQYAGDTRLQGLVSIYMTGDTRLLRNAIDLLDTSRTSEGATYSRAPSALQQYIPGFSLWWIAMVHDYWWYGGPDTAFVRRMLPGMRAVLEFFEARRSPSSGLLARLPWWPYVDWTPQWDGGVPPRGPQGESAPHDLQLALALKQAAGLEDALGNAALAAQDREKAEALRSAIRRNYWDEPRGLFADNTGRRDFSQETNALAVIAGVVEGDAARRVMERTLADTTLVQASTYFRAYVLEAMRMAGLGDRYLDMLDPWRKMLDLHLTTWAEALTFDRSDCHAWGASPNFELFRTVLGVDSAAPGFAKVSIRPHLGKLEEIRGVVPHPKGLIEVKLSQKDGKREFDIKLPPGVEGELDWGSVHQTLPMKN